MKISSDRIAHAFLFLPSLLLLSLLGACGGGGGTPSQVSAAPAPLTLEYQSLVTQATPTDYSSPLSTAAFSRLNEERMRCGFGALRQDHRLDQAASAHANYLAQLESGGWFTSSTNLHSEDPAHAGYTGATPLQRAFAAGYTSNPYESLTILGRPSAWGALPESVVDRMTRGLMAAPYHGQSMLSQAVDVGVGVVSLPQGTSTVWDNLVFDLGLGFAPGAGLGQRMASDALSAYPCDGTTGVPHILTTETPAPTVAVENHIAAGPGIYLMTRLGQTLTMTDWTLVDVASGQIVPATIIDSTNDRMRLILSHFLVLLPDAPLKLDSVYTASFHGTIDGRVVSKIWSFTTWQ